MWHISAECRQVLEAAYRGGQWPSAEQQAEFEALNAFVPEAPSRLLQVTSGTAFIEISGVITKTPSLFARLFGGGNVTYPEIVQAVDQAMQNPDVTKVELVVTARAGILMAYLSLSAPSKILKNPR